MHSLNQPQPVGINKPKNYKVDIQSVELSVRRLWTVAASMKLESDVALKLVSNGKSGMTRVELKNLEEHCFARTTVGDIDPPLFVYLSRNKEGKASLSVLRWSATNKSWDRGFVLVADPSTYKGEIFTTGKEEFNKYVLPVLNKLDAVRDGIVKNITKTKPNHIMWKGYFETHPKGAFWLQQTSPEAPNLQTGPIYRLYVNPAIRGLLQYRNIVKKVSDLAREYPHPLVYKFMCTGPKAESVIMDPDSSKICFYFKEKDDAIRFAGFLSDNFPEADGIKAAKIAVKERYEPHLTWRNGLFIVAKGTREERREIRQKALNIGNVRGQARAAVLNQLQLFSMKL